MSPLPFEPTSVRTSSDGMIAMWQQSSVVYTRVRGNFCRDHAQQLIKYVDAALAKNAGLIEQYHDWGDMTGYDLMSQKDLTLWTIGIRQRIKNLTILVHSPVVQMGVKLANAPLRGMIHMCESRHDFEALLNARLKRSIPKTA